MINMGSLDYIIVTTIVILNLSLVVLILSKNYRSLIYRNLAGFIFCFTLWIMSAFFSELTSNHYYQLVLSRATYASIEIAVLFFLSFVYAFIRKKIVFVFKVGITLFTMIIVFITLGTNLIIEKIIYSLNGFDIVFGALYPLFLITVFFFLVGIFQLVIKYFHSERQVKEQIRYFLFGLLVFIFINIIINVIVRNIIGNDSFYRIGNYSIVIFIVCTAYAIIRYRLMNIKFIITRSIIYLALVGLVSGLFIFISTVLAQSAEGFGINQYFIWALFAFFIVLGLDPLKNWFARITDKIFFKDKIDYNAELKRLSNIINEEIELDSLVNNFRLLLAQRLKLKHNSILLAAEVNEVYVPLDYFLHTNIPHSADQIQRQHLYNNSAFIHHLSAAPRTLVTDEFDRYIYDLDDGTEQQRLTKVLENLNALQAGAVVPIMRDNKLTAILVVGEKVSGETFASEDINLFEVVASQLAAALERSRLYQEVRVFNTKLQHEIDRATASLKQSNLQLEDANAHLQELDRAKSEFMSIASHQLRTPLTGIIGYLSMIIEGDYGKVDAGQNKVINQVFDASKRLVRLVNMFLNVTRIEAGRFTLTFVELNFVDLVRSEIAELLPTANQKKLQLSLDPATEENIPVAVDADKIRDVILNLIDNAIKYTQEGTIVVKVEREGKNEVRFSVKDTGVGVDPNEAKELFHKFVRGSGIARIQPNGSGLGLYIVKKIVEGHGGKVWMESEGEGKGSTFIVVLPVEQAKEQFHAEPEAVFK